MSTTPPPGPRLPHELILTILDWCDREISDIERRITLAAFCRVGNRALHLAAQRKLYSRLPAPYSDDPACQTSMDTLLLRPDLHKHVKAVALGSGGYRSRQTSRHKVEKRLFADLPNVDNIEYHPHEHALLRVLVSQKGIRLRRFRAARWDDELAWIVEDHPAAFSAVEHVQLADLDEFYFDPTPPIFAHLTSLAIDARFKASTFDELVGPLRGRLVHLSLPWSGSSKGTSVAGFDKLRSLRITAEYQLRADDFEYGMSAAVGLLSSARALPALVSVGVEGGDGCLHFDRGDWPRTRTKEQVLGKAKSVLDGLPPRLEHLSLDTGFFLVADVAVYLLGPSRPPGLRNLDIGGPLATPLAKILRCEEGPHGALSRTLKNAGVEMTYLNWSGRANTHY
ncbi:hypothetical protein JCM8208_001112 [Rhodotorula glutinis]